MADSAASPANHSARFFYADILALLDPESDRGIVERALVRRFDNVNEWLKYAEAKNAGLLAFSFTGLAAIVGYAGSVDDIPNGVVWLLVIGAAFIGFVALCALAAFVPVVTTLGLSMPREARKDDDNFEYFAHLAKYDAKAIVERVTFLTVGDQPADAGHDQGLLDIASQIAINSRITLQKLRLFSLGVYVLFLGAVLDPVSLAVRELVR